MILKFYALHPNDSQHELVGYIQRSGGVVFKKEHSLLIFSNMGLQLEKHTLCFGDLSGIDLELGTYELESFRVYEAALRCGNYNQAMFIDALITKSLLEPGSLIQCKVSSSELEVENSVWHS